MELQRHRTWFRISVAVAAVLASLIILSPVSKADQRFASLTEEEAKITLALHYMNDLREPMKGIRILTGLLEENPENTNVLTLLGNFSMQTGQYQKAQMRYQSLVGLTEGRDRENALFSLASASELAGDTATAIKSLREIIDISRDSLLLQSAIKRISLLNQP
jgi:tetratricopeptide (TPR) repeat protein